MTNGELAKHAIDACAAAGLGWTTAPLSKVLSERWSELGLSSRTYREFRRGFAGALTGRACLYRRDSQDKFHVSHRAGYDYAIGWMSQEAKR